MLPIGRVGRCPCPKGCRRFSTDTWFIHFPVAHFPALRGALQSLCVRALLSPGSH